MPQFVMQVAIADRSGFLVQAVTQVFCSPLQRIGVATAGQEPSMTIIAMPANVAVQDRR